MKNALVICNVLLISAGAYAFGGGEVQGGRPQRVPQLTTSVTPISGLTVQLLKGCGIPSPQGCPDETTISFVVPLGGSCHSYTAEVLASARGKVLTIYDHAETDCTRPEQIDFATSVSIDGDFTAQPITLANPIYVHRVWRP